MTHEKINTLLYTHAFTRFYVLLTIHPCTILQINPTRCTILLSIFSFTPTSRPDAAHTEWQIPVSHRHSNFSWWWARGCPKHVEKRNKYTKQNCAPSWICLQKHALTTAWFFTLPYSLPNYSGFLTNLIKENERFLF